jgi:hypothetical protein
MSRHAHGTRSSCALGTLLALMSVSCSTTPPPDEPPQFVGMSHWTSFARGTSLVHIDDPMGQSTVYIDRLPAHGATEFPVGTHIMRVMGSGSDPSQWSAHGMLKVGGDFNTGGAVGWEFYGLALSLDAHGELVSRTMWRGTGPPDGNGYVAADGGPILGCNHCHGATPSNDSVFGDELLLTSF